MTTHNAPHVEATTSVAHRPSTRLTGTAAPAGLPTRVFTEARHMRPASTQLTKLARPATHVPTHLVASQPTLDTKNRVGLGKLTRSVGIAAGDHLSAHVQGATVRVARATDEHARRATTSLRVDTQHRLTLSPGLCFTLGIRPGQQVQAIANPATGELTLISLANALAQLIDTSDVAFPQHGAA